MATITNDQLLRLIKKTGDIKQFDFVVKNVANDSHKRLINETPKDQGTLRRGWIGARKVGVASWIVINQIVTQGKKWNLAEIFNSGSRDMTKSKGFFYIPISKLGKNKELGAKIGKDLKFGVDYVLTKKRKGIKATHYIDNEEKKAARQLENDIGKYLDKVLR